MTRRLDPETARDVLARATPIEDAVPSGRRAPSVLAGRALDGSAIEWRLDRPTVVLLLSTTCDGCRELAGVVRDGAPGYAVVGALRASVGEGDDRDVLELTGGAGDWLLGDDAFVALDVTSAPFFVVVDGGSVVLEGVAFGARHLHEHLERARAGHPVPDEVRLRPRAT